MVLPVAAAVPSAVIVAGKADEDHSLRFACGRLDTVLLCVIVQVIEDAVAVAFAHAHPDTSRDWNEALFRSTDGEQPPDPPVIVMLLIVAVPEEMANIRVLPAETEGSVQVNVTEDVVPVQVTCCNGDCPASGRMERNRRTIIRRISSPCK